MTLLDDPGPPREHDRADTTPGRRLGARRALRRRAAEAGRWREAVVLAVAVLALVAGLGSLATPTVASLRTVLLQSFTKLPTRYTELYFTSSPTVDGPAVDVPVTVVDHSTGIRLYQVHVELRDDRGKVLAATEAGLVPRDGAAVPLVLHLPLVTGATTVWVTLPGHPQTLHYRIAGSNLPTTTGTP
ncbi:hypothetical protein [Streptacidiphilus fuscans]|uniref:Uncharacterized protein n=1 Tax=Streptacidiphilus fuscans TaxID=2789292 RepID=A0A931FB40_9ACTN|nr:hypothetical protein [Streptacidiphilus fuscans]MBF9068282.1 hypothetical protein [Streptacidiphilus fuscans]